MTDAGTIREISGELVPQPHGGALRLGGGRPVETEEQKAVRSLIKAGARDAAAALVRKAKKGDVRAIELVLAYVVGKPTERVEHSGPDGGPIEFLNGMNDHERMTLRKIIDEAVTASIPSASEGSDETAVLAGHDAQPG